MNSEFLAKASNSPSQFGPLLLTFDSPDQIYTTPQVFAYYPESRIQNDNCPFLDESFAVKRT